MIAEALKYLSDLTSKANAPVKLDVPDPRTVRFVFNGESHSFSLPEPPRAHHAGCLGEIIALANRFKDEPVTGAISEPEEPVVWYDGSRVVLVIDDGGHRIETATLTLETSDVFARLERLNKEKPWLDQKSFVRLLRIELARTLDPVVLLDKVRKLKFENGSITSGHVGRGSESLGREITSKVHQGEDIPEEVTLSCPVYKTPGETEAIGVRCSVEIEPTNGTFRLLPLPDELEMVRHVAVSRIGERLKEGLAEAIPCYHGNP